MTQQQNPILLLELPVSLINVVLAALAKQPLEQVIEAFSAVKQQADAGLAELEAPASAGLTE